MDSSFDKEIDTASPASTFAVDATTSLTSTPSPNAVDPPERKSNYIDTEFVVKLENGLKKFEPLLKPSSKRRNILGLALPFVASAGASLGPSGPSKSTYNAGATSIAFAKVSNHLNLILQGVDLVPSDEYTFTKYREKVEKIPIHRVQDEEIIAFTRTEDWRLIGLAADASDKAYKGAPEIRDGGTFEAMGNKKAMVIYVQELNGRRVLVVAIRGTVTKEDWMLNANGTPKKSFKLLGGSATWHGGFLMVAEAMQKETARAVAEASTKGDEINSILFTGHSAGGAIAQLFYAMSMSTNTTMSEAISGFKEVHCITFGAPPLASVPIPHGESQLHKPGAFLSVINEGDPVPLAQEEYIKALIDVYVLPNVDLEKRYPQGFHVPPPRLRVSGTCVVLRDVNPDDAEQGGLQACITDSEVVEKKLFGNPCVHFMEIYLERVKELRGCGECFD